MPKVDGKSISSTRARRLERGAIDLLPARVELLQLAGDGVRLFVGGRHHELHATKRTTQPSGGVQARGENEADAPGGERFSIEAGGANHRAHAGALRIVEELEAVPNEHTIFAAQRSDIRDRRQRDEIEHRVHRAVIASYGARERERQLERDAHRGEILVGRRTVGALGIQYRVCGRQRTARQVVIGDDHVDPRRLKLGDRTVRARSAVAGDHQLGAAFLRGPHAGIAEIVAVLQATRNERHGIAAERVQRSRHHRRRTDAVYVVVAVDEDRLVFAQREDDALYGAIEVGEAIRLVQMLEPRT